MRNLIAFIRDRHSLLYKGFLFVASLAVIVYFYPRDLRYSFETKDIKGQKWMHDDLIAPLSFAVQKSDDELQHEQNEIKNKFIPYFRFDSTIAELTEQNLFDQLQDLDVAERRKILAAVDAVYAGGVRAVSNLAHKGPQDRIL